MPQSTPIFITNLAGTDHRKRHMSAMMERLGLDYEFINCIDGREWTEEQIKEIVSDRLFQIRQGNKGWLTPGAIAATKTHLDLIYQRMVDENIPFAIGMEDDLVLPDNFPGIMEHMHEWASSIKMSGIVLLHWHIRENEVVKAHSTPAIDKSPLKGKLLQLHPLQNIGSGACYFVSLDTAKKLVDSQKPLDRIGDWWKDHEELGVINNMYILHPRVVDASAFESTLQYQGTGIKSVLSKQIKKTKWGRKLIFNLRNRKSGKVMITPPEK
ncbi:MAG: glycosyltransferase family 25 protein [Bacteroidota bacterium]